MRFCQGARAALTCDFAVDHDVQVLLWVGADVSGDGMQADLGVVQRKTQTRAIEPGETPGKNTEAVKSQSV